MSSHPDFNIVVNLLNNISIYPIISQCSYRFPIWTPSEYINLFPVLHSLKLFLNCSQTVLVTHVLHALRVSNSISTGAKTTTSNMSRVGWREARDGSAAWGSAKKRRLCGEGSHGGQYLRGSHLVLNRRQRKRTAVAIEDEDATLNSCCRHQQHPSKPVVQLTAQPQRVRTWECGSEKHLMMGLLVHYFD